MEGVITAAVAFVFVCVIKPELIKSKPQFYLGFALLLVTMLIFGIGQIFPAENFVRLLSGLNSLLAAAAVIVLFLSAGGISIRDFTGEMKGAFEVLRRGETEKETIIPLESQKKAREDAQRKAAAKRAAEIAAENAAEDDMPITPAPVTPPTPRPKANPNDPIPFD